MTGHGGWPLNASSSRPTACRSTPAPTSRPSRATAMPSWPQRAARGRRRVGDAARRDRRAGARMLRAAASARARLEPTGEPPRPDGARRRAGARCATVYDAEYGGFGRRAEVPARLDDRVPARAAASARCRCTRCARWPTAASTTRSAAASRATRSTPYWIVPHFEKMLYDNALLARAYLHGWQVTGDAAARGASCEETLDWVLRELRQPRGRLHVRARRRLRGRRGQVLRLDARRAARGRSATTPTRRSPRSG